MRNTKLLFLEDNSYSTLNFLKLLKASFQDIIVFNNQSNLYEFVHTKKDTQSLLIIFISDQMIDEVFNHIDFDFSKHLFIKYYQGINKTNNYNQIFDMINIDNDEAYFRFFINKLEHEINNRKKIDFLENEVKVFYEIGKSLTSEKNTIKLLEKIINSSIQLTSSDAGTMYLVIDEKTGKWSSVRNNSYHGKMLKFVITKNMSIDIKLEESISPITKESIAGNTIITGRSIRIDDAYSLDPSFEYKHNNTYDEKVGYRTISILSIPMKDYEDNIMGVIQLINKKHNKNEKIDYKQQSFFEKILPYDYSDELIMNSLAGQAAVSLENNLLYEGMRNLLNDYKKQNEQLSVLSRKILKAHEEERKRIARDIHDGPAQLTANLSLKLGICKKYFSLNDYGNAYNEITSLKDDVNSTIKEIRTIIYDLKPSYLESGIILALETRLRIFEESTDIHVHFSVSGDDSKIEYYITSTIYKIVQEALNNIVKHAKASNVNVNLIVSDKDIIVSIKDNGKGFDSGDPSKVKSLKGGFGLEGIRERVELVKGELNITSEVGKGTEVYVRIPMD